MDEKEERTMHEQGLSGRRNCSATATDITCYRRLKQDSTAIDWHLLTSSLSLVVVWWQHTAAKLPAAWPAAAVACW